MTPTAAIIIGALGAAVVLQALALACVLAAWSRSVRALERDVAEIRTLAVSVNPSLLDARRATLLRDLLGKGLDALDAKDFREFGAAFIDSAQRRFEFFQATLQATLQAAADGEQQRGAGDDQARSQHGNDSPAPAAPAAESAADRSTKMAAGK